MVRKIKSPILEAVHETAKGLHQSGAMKQMTMREFDRLKASLSPGIKVTAYSSKKGAAKPGF